MKDKYKLDYEVKVAPEIEDAIQDSYCDHLLDAAVMVLTGDELVEYHIERILEDVPKANREMVLQVLKHHLTLL